MITHALHYVATEKAIICSPLQMSQMSAYDIKIV